VLLHWRVNGMHVLVDGRKRGLCNAFRKGSPDQRSYLPLMVIQTPPDLFTSSAFLTYLHSVVPATETQPLIAQMLAILGEPDPSVAEALASIAMRRESYFDLALWAKRLEPHPWRNRLGAAAVKFWAAQTLVTTVLRPTVFDPNQTYPRGLIQALAVGAEGLYDLGVSQFDGLAVLGIDLVAWIAAQGLKRVALVESPIGNTIPVQFIAALARKRGLSAEIVQWNAPRNDRAKRGRTVEESAAICGADTQEFDLVVLVDECLTGTRFLKLFNALIGPVGKDRLLPIAMLFQDSQRNDLTAHPKRARLIETVQAQGEHIGYSNCHVGFPQQRLFQFDGPFSIWPSPVIWGDSDLIAGKRKINLTFMLIDHYKNIIADLAQHQSVFLPHLTRPWSLDERGRLFVFAPGLVQSTFDSLCRQLPLDPFRNELWAKAKERFPEDYDGSLGAMSHTGVWQRYDWLRTAFIEEAGRRVGKERAGMLYHAVDTVFSASFHEQKPQVARDLDATCYTIPFNETIRALNGRLIRRLLSRVDELELLNAGSEGR
jgi:hypothetical protein